MWLLLSSAVVIALAFAYTLVPRKDWRLEAVLTTTLVFSLVAAAVYLFVHYRKVMRMHAKAAAKRARSTIVHGRKSLSSARRSTHLRFSHIVTLASMHGRGSMNGGRPPPPPDGPPPPPDGPPPPPDGPPPPPPGPPPGMYSNAFAESASSESVHVYVAKEW